MKQLYGSVFSGALLAALIAAPSLCGAQPVQPPTQAEAQAALNPAPAAFTQPQLDQMLAPIALYPDQLLTQLLMAATFPDQVIDAGKWLQDSKNAALTGNDLVAALQPLPWDPSVKSLVAFPQIIVMMNDHFDWTQALGTAFANQQVETMARIQFLRERAVSAGQLKTTPQLKVDQQGGEVLIEPVDPTTVYVPVYNPAVVYGNWPDSDDPPVYIPPPPGFYNGDVGPGIGYSVPLVVVATLWGWGHFNWQQHEVVVDPGRYQHLTTPGATTGNHVALQNQVWHRTAPVVQVPVAQRPPPPANQGQHPPGTVAPTAIKPPAPPAGGTPPQQGAPPTPGKTPPAPPAGTHAPPPPPGAHAPPPPTEHAPPAPPTEHAPPPPPTQHAPPPPPTERAPPPPPVTHAPPPPPPAAHAPPPPPPAKAPPPAPPKKPPPEGQGQGQGEQR